MAGPICETCRHPKVVEINGRLLAGEAQSRVARDYGLSEDSVHRHWHNHVADRMRAAADAHAEDEFPRLAVIEGEVLLGQAGEILMRAKALLASLDRDDVDPRARVYALAEVRKSLESLAKLNVMVSEQSKGAVARTEATEIDAAILRALEARGDTPEQSQGTSEPAPIRELMPPAEG